MVRGDRPSGAGAAARRAEPGVQVPFAPPPVPPRCVTRPRLALLLDLAAHQRLTIVSAPPGYGKTVLLAQWATANPRRRVRWLVLEPSHDDPTTLNRNLRRALGVESASRHAASPFQVDDPAAGRLLGPALTEVDDVPPTTLVLDDFQRLSDRAALDHLAAFIGRAPRRVRFVLATRADPPPRYYRLDLSEFLIEVHEEDLAFTDDEGAALIRRSTGTVLEPGQASRLVALTEGWPVGLQLAAVELRRGRRVGDLVESLAGADGHVGRYLIKEVLNQQPDQVREFLLSTCVLERMNGPLCDYVTGRPGSAALLDEFDRRSTFIARTGPGNRWFRYHHLFRNVLLRQLRARDPEIEGRLLLRAAEWYLDRDDVETGVGCLMDAGAWPEVVGAAHRYGREMLARDRTTVVAAWIARVPPAARRVDDGLALLRAASLAMGGAPAQALEALDAPRGTGAAGSPSRAGHDAVAKLLRSYSLLLLGRLRKAVDEADRALAALARVAYDNVPDGDLPDGDLPEVDLPEVDVPDVDLPDVLGLTRRCVDVVAGALTVRGTALLYLGRPDEAREAVGAVSEEAPGLWRVLALGTAALLEAWCGRLTPSEQQGAWALALARQLGMEEQPTTSAAHLALAVSALERNDLTRARTHMDAAWSRLPLDPRRVLTTVLAIEEGRLALAEGRPASGLRILADRRTGRTSSLPSGISARRQAVEAQLLLAVADPNAAERALHDAPCVTSDVAVTRLELAIDREELPAARALLSEWPLRPQPRVALEKGLWQAVVAHLEGDDDEAFGHAAPVAVAASVENHLGLFRNHHVLAVTRALYRATPNPFLRSVVEQLAATPSGRSSRWMVDRLTDREHAMLQLLPTRLSNAEIADTLDVSLNTVKTHLKHIYRKLDVNGRREAVDAAERLLLI